MTLDPQQLTVVALLFGIGAAGLAKKWVFGWVYAALEDRLLKTEADRDFWRDTALKALGHADKALDVAQGGHSGG